MSKIKFFGFIISIKDIQINLEKVTIILNWAYPTSLYYIKLFLEFYNFY